jgi:hypothetical protein
MDGKSVMIWITAGLALLLAATVGLVLWRIGRLRHAVAAAKLWPATQGRVVEGSIYETSIYLPKGGRAVTYHANLVYEYAVAGRAYRSNHFHIDGPQAYSFRRRAEAHLKKWPPGSEVTVYYDPAQPERAALTRQAQRIATLWFALALGGGIAIVLLGFLVFQPGLYGRDALIRL